MGLDIGPPSGARFSAAVKAARTIVWNGPMGVFEKPPFAAGTIELARAIAESRAFSVIGGGDTVAAENLARVADRIAYISEAGARRTHVADGRTPAGTQAL